ncbi:enhancer of mRNA-decapping protein 3-like [Saccostrea echinata]|uniref:enhancer of mRNA-decapping protein 3-like n=1 Tax=Saccostrea echinata TaxID=191078 RepID=UPI002A81706A|nr:enhancer of mRNA-decapping protein 3-like [Saccostrea echinata]
MTSAFVGCIVSLDCGEVLGTYQGQVTCINNSSQELTLIEAFRNGLKCPVSEITLNASDIKELKIMKNPTEAISITNKQATPSKLSPENNNDVIAPSPVKIIDKPVSVVLSERQFSESCSVRNGNNRGSQESNGNGNMRRSGSAPRMTNRNGNNSPINGINRYTPTNGNGCNRYTPPCENGSRYIKYTPTKEEQRTRRNSTSETRVRNSSAAKKIEFRHRGPSQGREDCFSAPSESYLQDFDFEKNLALFDKKAVFEEIESANPELTKVVETKKPQKYRCDENVLQSAPVVYQQIKVPKAIPSNNSFVTDSGLVVPSISYEWRKKLFETAEKLGFKRERQIEMVGRSACEMVLQLLGGSTRLNPQNGHQLPTVMVLCGPHLQGAYGVNCARQLSNHNVKVQVFMPGHVKVPAYMEDELTLFDSSEGKRTASLKDLPSSAVDIIINAMDTHENTQYKQQGWFIASTEWANHNRAPVLSIDPPANGASVQSKWSICICLPLTGKEGNSSQVYLCDLGFPKKVFTDHGIKYISPFSHKFIIPLHSQS